MSGNRNYIDRAIHTHDAINDIFAFAQERLCQLSFIEHMAALCYIKENIVAAVGSPVPDDYILWIHTRHHESDLQGDAE